MNMNILVYKLFRRIKLFLEKGNDLYQKQFCLTGERTKFYQSAKVNNMSNIRERICVGRNTHIRGELFVYPYGGCIIVGNDCYIGEGTRIWAEKNVQIGDRVLISHNVDIHDCNDHPIDARERHQHFLNIIASGHPKGFDLKAVAVRIGDDAWIGFGASVMRGVTIGEGAVVGAGAVVTHDVPAWTVVAGNPAREVKKLPH